MNEIQKLLHNYRKNHNLRQLELAKFLEVSQSQVCRWERGVHVPSKLRIINIKTRIQYARPLEMGNRPSR